VRKKFMIFGVLTAFVLVAVIACSNGIPYSNQKSFGNNGWMTEDYDPGSNLNLIWSCEFSAVSETNKWAFDTGTGTGGWGNSELEYYRTQNATVSNGNLKITVKRESYGGKYFTSARMKTLGKFTFRYGKVAARIKGVYGKGLWPAFWMMGDSPATWPANGEIDIMEMMGTGTNEDKISLAACHWYNAGHAYYSGAFTNGETLASNYHIYEAEWTPSNIIARIDGTNYFVIDTTPAALDEFRSSNFYILLNCAVGGTFWSPPLTNTNSITAPLPQTLYVDWVRVYACNLAVNPGFESGVTNQPDSWAVWCPNGEYDSVIRESYGGARTGTYHLTHYRATPYTNWTYQIRTGLLNGNYTLKAWVRSTGGQTLTYMQAKNYNPGGSYKITNIPTSLTNWRQVVLTNIPVTSNQCEIGFYSASPAYNWIYVDDVEFYKQ
jgi:beta-glucanase (GH16 family)